MLLYTLFDVLSAIAANAAGTELRPAARSLLRYALGASVAVTAGLSALVQTAAITIDPTTAALADAAAWPPRWQIAAFLVVALIFYPAAGTFTALSSSRTGGRLSPPVALAIATAGAVLGPPAISIAFGAASLMQVAFGGRISTVSEACDLGDGLLHFTAGIRNGRSGPLAISRNSLELQITPRLPTDRDVDDAFLENRWRISLLFDKLDGGMLVIKPGEVAVFSADAYFDDETWNLIRASKGKIACRLAPFSMAEPAFRTEARKMRVPQREPVSDPGAMDASPAGVPIYRPGERRVGTEQRLTAPLDEIPPPGENSTILRQMPERQ